jgi:hypothetical protein
MKISMKEMLDLVREVITEMNSTADVVGYNAPMSSSKKDDEEED